MAKETTANKTAKKTTPKIPKSTKKATPSTTNILVIPSKKTVLSASQKTYNKYIKEIDKQKLEVQNLEKDMNKLQQRVHSEIFPEMDKLQELRLQRLEIMDSFFSEKLSEKHSNDLYKAFFDEISLIVGESNVYPMSEKIMEKVIKLHDKHAEQTYEEIMKEGKEEAKEYMKSNLEDFGIDDFDMQDFDMEKILEELERKREENKNKRQQQRMDKDENFAAKKNAEKEQQQERSKTVKGIYKRLVKDLHPDLESDVDEQARKNELMQRITRAYNENDFFELLKLNIEHQTRNKSDVSKLADQEIEYYNQILKSQIQDLKANIRGIKKHFLYEYYGGTPQRTGQIIRRCKDKINQEKEDYQEVTNLNFSSLKDWKQSLNNKIKIQDDDSIFSLIFGGNSEEMAYQQRMDFIYGPSMRMPFGF